MRILGIDCGTQATGYGLVESDGRSHSLVEAGVIRTSPIRPLAERLGSIHDRLSSLIAELVPVRLAVETVFHAVNSQSALKLAHVRGVVLLAAAQARLDVGEYSPLEVKQSVVGYGRAAKGQVQQMVASLLGLTEIVRPDDAADALAVAICHATHSFSEDWKRNGRRTR